MSKQLDFSGINKIAYKGFEERPEERDSLLEAGYTVVDTPTPFEATSEKESAQPSAGISSAPPPMAAGRDYKRLYRIAFDFHHRHNPPTVNREYWRTHTPGEDEPPPEELRYWEEAAKDLAPTLTAGKTDPFLQALLIAVFEELEREYKKTRDNAHKSP